MIEEKFLYHNVNREVKLIAAGKNLIILLFQNTSSNYFYNLELHESLFYQIDEPKNTNSELL